MELAELHKYYLEKESYVAGVIMANAYHSPEKLKQIDPDKPPVPKLENVHPFLRPTREKNPSGR